MKYTEHIEIDDFFIIDYLVEKMNTDEAEDYIMPIVRKYVISDCDNLENIINSANAFIEFHKEIKNTDQKETK